MLRDASKKADSEIQVLGGFSFDLKKKRERTGATGNDKDTVRTAGPTAVKAAQSRCGFGFSKSSPDACSAIIF